MNIFPFFVIKITSCIVDFRLFFGFNKTKVTDGEICWSHKALSVARSSQRAGRAAGAAEGGGERRRRGRGCRAGGVGRARRRVAPVAVSLAPRLVACRLSRLRLANMNWQSDRRDHASAPRHRDRDTQRTCMTVVPQWIQIKYAYFLILSFKI